MSDARYKELELWECLGQNSLHSSLPWIVRQRLWIKRVNCLYSCRKNLLKFMLLTLSFNQVFSLFLILAIFFVQNWIFLHSEIEFKGIKKLECPCFLCIIVDLFWLDWPTPGKKWLIKLYSFACIHFYCSDILKMPFPLELILVELLCANINMYFIFVGTISGHNPTIHHSLINCCVYIY